MKKINYLSINELKYKLTLLNVPFKPILMKKDYYINLYH